MEYVKLYDFADDMMNLRIFSLMGVLLILIGFYSLLVFKHKKHQIFRIKYRNSQLIRMGKIAIFFGITWTLLLLLPHELRYYNYNKNLKNNNVDIHEKVFQGFQESQNVQCCVFFEEKRFRFFTGSTKEKIKQLLKNNQAYKITSYKSIILRLELIKEGNVKN